MSPCPGVCLGAQRARGLHWRCEARTPSAHQDCHTDAQRQEGRGHRRGGRERGVQQEAGSCVDVSTTDGLVGCRLACEFGCTSPLSDVRHYTKILQWALIVLPYLLVR